MLSLILNRTATPFARCYSTRADPLVALQAAFRDPASPFYLAPGTQGPTSPDDVAGALGAAPSAATEPPAGGNADTALTSPQEQGRAKLTRMGFDPLSFFEQKIVWGDLDSFRHLNNVRYVRFLESGRIHWMMSFAQEIGGPQRVRDMLAGRGVSLILKDISVKFKRPVTFPDTLLVAHRPHDAHATHFSGAAAVWSYAQRAVVATSDSTLVWYDYDTLKKCDPGQDVHAVIEKRIQRH